MQKVKYGLGGKISNNQEATIVQSRDRHTFYQDKCKNNYIGVGRKIERHSVIDSMNIKKTNGRCERFHDRELPLPTWYTKINFG